MPTFDRRLFLQSTAAAAASLLPRLPAWGADDAPTRVVQFPEKTDLIMLIDRPPNLETPLKFFRQEVTPNEAFFVRWHLALIPTSVDEQTFRLVVKGHVDQPLSLSLDALKKDFEPASVVAVNQ